MPKRAASGDSRKLATPQPVNAAVKSMCDIMRRSNCADASGPRRREPGARRSTTAPLTLAHFEEFFRLLPERAESEHSWTVTRPELEARGYDLKAVNPHAKPVEDTRTPEELLDLIESKGQKVAAAIAELRALRAK